ncbi:hypothetical protein NO1_1199 [Candidatus Termititenax aidoneus]|uniref:Uncharacterized protein n=1 Tax=Termititenax aidoneus TaxID=2218524 RepID=A0A388TB38_TERA1|nr:hypothetical protein NO1_1199 [Candidatus Termititenax aidoneus]
MLLHNKGHRNFTGIEVSKDKFETLVAGGSLDVPEELAKKLVGAYPNELTAGDYSKTKSANTADVKNLKAELKKANEQLAGAQAETEKVKAELKAVGDELATTKGELEKANSILAETKTTLEKVTAEKVELTKALDKATAGKKEK